MEYEGIIYRYKSPSGKYYIGQTIEEERRRRDFLGKKKIYAGPKINRARNKYGPENFEYAVLVKVTGDDPEEVNNYLNVLEIGFIRMYNSVENGYNSCDGGQKSVKGFHHSDETKKRLSEMKTGKPSWNKGIPMSEETKEKQRLSHIGKQPNLGKHLSEETRRKISESHKGRSNYCKGIPKSEEHKKKLSEARKGKHRVYSPDGSFHYE